MWVKPREVIKCNEIKRENKAKMAGLFQILRIHLRSCKYRDVLYVIGHVFWAPLEK